MATLTRIEEANLGILTRRVLEKYRVIFVQNRMGDAGQSGLQASLELLQSFRSDVSEADGGNSGVLSLAFAEYGRILDMKRRSNRWRHVAPVDNIRAWMSDKGEQAFLAKYSRRRNQKNPDSDLDNIAWAIAKTIKKKGIKRRSWYSKNRERDIQRMYDELVETYQEFILQRSKKDLQNVS